MWHRGTEGIYECLIILIFSVLEGLVFLKMAFSNCKFCVYNFVAQSKSLLHSILGQNSSWTCYCVSTLALVAADSWWSVCARPQQHCRRAQHRAAVESWHSPVIAYMECNNPAQGNSSAKNAQLYSHCACWSSTEPKTALTVNRNTSDELSMKLWEGKIRLYCGFSGGGESYYWVLKCRCEHFSHFAPCLPPFSIYFIELIIYATENIS